MATPDYKDLTYKKRIKDWQKMEAFKNGDVKKYIFKWEQETDDGHKTRVNNAELVNITEKTIQAANGIVFKKEVMYNEKDISPDFLTRIENIDNQESDLNEFFRQAGLSSLWYGVSYILIDLPRCDEQVCTLLEQREKGLIPYFTLIEAPQVFNTRIKNKKLTQITIHETIIEEDGEYGEKVVEQFRVLTIGHGKIIRGSETIYEWDTGLNFIPIVPMYSKKEGYFDAKPPFLNVANLNIAHINFISQLWKTLYIAANPVPVIYGSTQDNNKMTIGVDTALKFSSKQEGGFEWVEFSGQSVDKLNTKITALEKNMSNIGLSIISQIYETATDAKISNSKETSDLSNIATSFEWAINSAYKMFCQILGYTEPNGIEFIIDKDFNLAVDIQLLTLYTQMYEKGLMTIDMVWNEFLRKEALSDFDKEKTKAELEAKLSNTFGDL